MSEQCTMAVTFTKFMAKFVYFLIKIGQNWLEIRSQTPINKIHKCRKKKIKRLKGY